jgi:hypothetical protein
MFRGDTVELGRTLRRATTAARWGGRDRVRSEHLLIALAAGRGPVAEVLVACGVTTAALRPVLRDLPAAGAGAVADRELLGTLGIDIGELLTVDPGDVPPRRASRFGPDAAAAYAASLRLALARRERAHRPEHLALVLVTLDAGVRTVLARAGVDPDRVLRRVAAAFPPPPVNPVLRCERRLAGDHRRRAIVRRYQRTTGRVVIRGALTRELISRP